jgi:hypothetical protein
MSVTDAFKKARSSFKLLGITLAGSFSLLGQEAEAQTAPQPAPPPASSSLNDKLSDIFNHSEVTGTGWSLPVASLNSSGTTSLRVEVGYADATPGVYIRQTTPDGGKIDAGFMNFSQNIFPIGDTLSFNSKGDLYSNGEQTGDQLGIRYNNKISLTPTSSFEYNAFAGWAVDGRGVSYGVNGDYRKNLGQWNLLAGGGVSWLGERGVTAFNGIVAVDRHFTYGSLPDGKLTTGVLLKDELGNKGISKATAFAEYQSHLVTDNSWFRHISALFSGYAGTQSYGGKAGLLYSPGVVGAKDFGVSFGPSVGWDSRERGPQFNLELRAGF